MSLKLVARQKTITINVLWVIGNIDKN